MGAIFLDLFTIEICEIKKYRCPFHTVSLKISIHSLKLLIYQLKIKLEKSKYEINDNFDKVVV